MPPRPRLFVSELPVHVTLRGVNRQDIVASDGDRLRFLDCLGEATRKFEVAVHAYALMTNHVHLLLTAISPDCLAKAIQSLGRRYVAYFNQRYERTGTLWEGRYRSTVVDTDRYLFAVYRYIELNSLRAGLVSEPAQDAWSSHLRNAYGKPDDLVTEHPGYSELGDSPGQRQIAYRSMFADPLSRETLDRIRSASNLGWAMGEADFCQKLEQRLGRRVEKREKWNRGRRRIERERGRPPKE